MNSRGRGSRPRVRIHFTVVTAIGTNERFGYEYDFGGSWGYEHYLAVLADPAHEEHDHLSQWRGPFDAKAFDLALVNAHLQAVR